MPAPSTALCNSFKQDLLNGVHNFGSHNFKLALIKENPTDQYGAGTRSYNNSSHTTAGEALTITNNDEHVTSSSSGSLGYGYTTGGAACTVQVYLHSSSGRAFVDITNNPSFSAATIDSDGCLIYNDSVTGKPAVCVIGFGSTQSSDNGNFQITIPDPNLPSGSTAIIRII